MSFHRNEYDSMKDMLNKTRSYQFKAMLNESGAIPNLTPEEEEDEKHRFSQSVTTNVQFGRFQTVNGNIQFSGLLVQQKISWVFSLDQNIGCFISGEQIQLTDDTVRVIQNLKGYFDVWSKYWNEQLSSI